MPPVHSEQLLNDITNSISSSNGIIVLDFDGVVANTEPLHLRAYLRLLEGSLPQNATFRFDKYMGHPEEEIYTMINSDYGLELSITEDKPKRLQIFRTLVKECDLQPANFVHSLLAVRGSGYVLSSQDMGLTSELLTAWRIRDRLEVIDYHSSFSNKLSAIPQLARILDVAPDRIFHFEDSARAIDVSSRSGHHTIFVRHDLNRTVKVEATWVIDFY